MIVELAYGSGTLPVELPEARTTVIRPTDHPGLADERHALLESLRNPIGTRPLSEWIRPGARICILFTDITRATPNERIIPWLLEHLESLGVRDEQITLLNQLGTHRPNTPGELRTLLTDAVFDRYRVLNHEPYSREACTGFGVTRTGAPVLLNRECAEADVRIVTGFIEPHFFAGFSGGPKGIMPGVAHVDTVQSNHGEHHIGHANATFGVCEGNPLWEELLEIALRVGPSFLLNVSLNPSRRITGLFAGDLRLAHAAGRRFVRESAMQAVDGEFDVVVTTNSGYPLDQNLYQGVKGLAAAGRIARPGGLVLLAAECREGVPSGSPYDQLLREGRDMEEVLALLATPGFSRPEQWQAQIQGVLQRRLRVRVKSDIPDAVLRAAHLEPCHDIAAAVVEELRRRGPEARVAVLPQGPLTIPYARQRT